MPLPVCKYCLYTGKNIYQADQAVNISGGRQLSIHKSIFFCKYKAMLYQIDIVSEQDTYTAINLWKANQIYIDNWSVYIKAIIILTI